MHKLPVTLSNSVHILPDEKGGGCLSNSLFITNAFVTNMSIALLSCFDLIILFKLV